MMREYALATLVIEVERFLLPGRGVCTPVSTSSSNISHPTNALAMLSFIFCRNKTSAFRPHKHILFRFNARWKGRNDSVTDGDSDSDKDGGG